MKLANWFKVTWWLLLIALLSWFLAARRSAVVGGTYTAFDLAVLAIWIILAAAPLFSELEIGSLKLKTKLDEVKDHVDDQVEKLRTEIRNTIDFRTQINPQFVIPNPPPDSQLPSLEERIRTALTDALREHGLTQVKPDANVFTVDAEVAQLFAVRYRLERAVNRIAAHRELVPTAGSARMRPTSLPHLARQLVDTGLIEPSLSSAIREVYAICSAAIHGGEVTDAKINFVRRVAPQLLATLEAIGE